MYTLNCSSGQANSNSLLVTADLPADRTGESCGICVDVRRIEICFGDGILARRRVVASPNQSIWLVLELISTHPIAFSWPTG